MRNVQFLKKQEEKKEKKKSISAQFQYHRPMKLRPICAAVVMIFILSQFSGKSALLQASVPHSSEHRIPFREKNQHKRNKQRNKTNKQKIIQQQQQTLNCFISTKAKTKKNQNKNKNNHNRLYEESAATDLESKDETGQHMLGQSTCKTHDHCCKYIHTYEKVIA